MKKTGMNRKVDDLGRVVIPAEIRKAFGIREGDHLDIAVDGEHIVLTRLEESCVFCRSVDDLKEFRGRLVCTGCMREMAGEPDVPEWDPFSEM
jgi:AbrB family transcriptional regulator, transcriptional pleiotropic regulator of transition state genes